jgi:hypothetical protein
LKNTDTEFTEIRRRIVSNILAKQDSHFRWAFDERIAKERPELIYYWPKYKSTFWTLLLLADIKAPTNNWRIDRSTHLVMNHLYDKSHKIFTIGSGHFPIPCLNGNMLYLHFYFKKPYTKKIDQIVEFFNSYQRFDDGDFKTPKSFPYFSNTACYGKHTCYWGIIKLLKGLSFIPATQRTENVRRLIENCIDFVLHHEVCFRSHNKDEFIRPDISYLTFPSLKDDFLEVLWLLAREGISDKRVARAIELLRSKMKTDGYWELEHSVSNLIVSMGRKGCANAFITERAFEVLNRSGI